MRTRSSKKEERERGAAGKRSIVKEVLQERGAESKRNSEKRGIVGKKDEKWIRRVSAKGNVLRIVYKNRNCVQE